MTFGCSQQLQIVHHVCHMHVLSNCQIFGLTFCSNKKLGYRLTQNMGETFTDVNIVIVKEVYDLH